MLTCKDVTDRFTDYDERRLPWQTRLEVGLHLFMCRHCRRYYDQMVATVRALRSLGQARPGQVDKTSAMRAFEAWKQHGR